MSEADAVMTAADADAFMGAAAGGRRAHDALDGADKTDATVDGERLFHWVFYQVEAIPPSD